MWRHSGKVSPLKVKLVGGDQKCENMASKLKEQLRRTNKLGRSGAKTGGAARDGLSAWWLKAGKILLSEVFSNLGRDALL